MVAAGAAPPGHRPRAAGARPSSGRAAPASEARAARLPAQRAGDRPLRAARLRARRATGAAHYRRGGELRGRDPDGDLLDEARTRVRRVSFAEIADPLLQARGAGPRALRAGQAGRGGPARARARARRQARVERGPVRPVPGGARGARRGGAAS